MLTNGMRERMGGRRTGARELEDGGTQRGEHVASRATAWARAAARARAAASRASSWASASTPPRRPPSVDASWASAAASRAASWARGELGGRRHGASSGEGGAGRARWMEARGKLGKPGAGGGDEVRRAHVRDSSPGGWDRRDKERKEKRRKN